VINQSRNPTIESELHQQNTTFAGVANRRQDTFTATREVGRERQRERESELWPGDSDRRTRVGTGKEKGY